QAKVLNEILMCDDCCLVWPRGPSLTDLNAPSAVVRIPVVVWVVAPLEHHIPDRVSATFSPYQGPLILLRRQRTLCLHLIPSYYPTPTSMINLDPFSPFSSFSSFGVL